MNRSKSMAVAATFAVLGATDDGHVFVGASIFLACGTALLGPAPAAYAADIAPESQRGLAMGLFRSAGDVGFVLGPYLLGQVADHGSRGLAFGLNAAGMALVTLAFAWIAPESRGAEAGNGADANAGPTGDSAPRG